MSLFSDCSKYGINSILVESFTLLVGTRERYNRHLNVGQFPVHIAVNTFENKAYVANWDSRNISVIDGDTLKVRTVRVGLNPDHIAVDDFFNIIYVANFASNSVSVIDGDTLKVRTVRVGLNPDHIAVDDFFNIIYVANEGSGTVSIINGTGVLSASSKISV